MEISLSIRGQELKLLGEQPKLYHGSVGVLYIKCCDVNFDKSLIKTFRFKTEDSDWYTQDVADGKVRVPHEVIKVGGFDVAVGGYDTENGELVRFLPTNSVHIDVLENGYGEPDAPLMVEGEIESVIGKIDKKADIEYIHSLLPKSAVKGTTVDISDHIANIETVDFKIYGNTVQDTDNGKNLFKYPYYSKNMTVNGIKFVVGNDGTVSATGTATDDAVFSISRYNSANNSLHVDAGKTYTLSGCPDSAADSAYKISVVGAGFFANCTGNAVTRTAAIDADLDALITVYKGKTVKDIIFKPQIEEGESATEFERYNPKPSPKRPSELCAVETDGKDECTIDILIKNDDDNVYRTTIKMNAPLRKFGECCDVLDLTKQIITRRVGHIELTADMDWQISENGIIYTELPQEKAVKIEAGVSVASNYSSVRNGYIVAINDGEAIGFDVASGMWQFNDTAGLINWLKSHEIYAEYLLKNEMYESTEQVSVKLPESEKIQISLDSKVPGTIEAVCLRDINKLLAKAKTAQ